MSENSARPELPESWEWRKVGDIATVIRGVSYKKDQCLSEPREGYLPLLRSGNVQARLDLEKKLVYVPEDLIRGDQHLTPGDIVVSVSNSRELVGKAAPLSGAWEGTFGAFLGVVRPIDGAIDPGFLGWFFRSPEYRQVITSLSAATSNIANIRKGHLLNLDIPVPPLDEQKRIAERIRLAFSEVAEGEEHLDRAVALQATFFDQTLRRILHLGEPGIPVGWSRRKLSEIAALSSGGTPARSRPEHFGPGHLWVKIGDLTEAKVDTAAESITNSGLANSSAELLPSGTVLLAMYGASIGRTGILTVEASTNQAICAMQPDLHYVTADFLLVALQARKKTFVAAGYGGAQPNISQRFLKDFEVLLPPLEQQETILDRVGTAKLALGASRSSVGEGRAQAARLRRSVLAAAVCGSL